MGSSKAERFLALHRQQQPLLLANAWDWAPRRLLTSLGFQALATTSSGYAATLGRLDYSISREEALAHAAALVAATDLPVSADFEDGFAADPDGVAETVRLALDIGLAGCSVEDWSARRKGGSTTWRLPSSVWRLQRRRRTRATARLVLTARAENYLHGNPDLRDTIARLQAYQQAGADVLYAPGLHQPEELRELLASVELPVNVLARPGAPSVTALGALGVKRVSVGGAFAFAAFGAVTSAANELLGDGSYGFLEPAVVGFKAVRAAFAD